MIDEATMKSVTAKLLFESLTAEDREKLLTGALASIIEPQRGQYGVSQKSKLQDMFDNTAGVCANQIVVEHFKKPEVRERIEALVVQGVEQAFSGEFVERLTGRLLNGLWQDR